MRSFFVYLAVFGGFILQSNAVDQAGLQKKVASIAADAQGTVSVSCLLPGTPLNCDLNPHNHPPMQSVFKYPLVLTVLHRVDTGKLLPSQRHGEPLSATLDRTIRFLPEDRIPHAYSPLTDRYPQANVDVSLRELIQYTAGQSDNAAADLLLRIVGGPAVVQNYIRSLGITGFQLQDSEHGLHADPTAQYRNWFEPAAAAQLLQRLVSNPPISSAANDFLLQTLTNSAVGASRLPAGLPAGTVIAHKTGTSGEHNGKAEATNDIGLITLPDGRHLAVAVFMTDARANGTTRDDVIARIGRAAYDEAQQMSTPITAGSIVVGAQADKEAKPAPMSPPITISLSIAVPTEHVPVGQKVWVSLTVKNLGTQEINYPYDRVHVDGPNGEPPTTLRQRQLTMRLNPGEPQLRMDRFGSYIQPGASFTRKYDLSMLYDLSEPGKYTVYIEALDETAALGKTKTDSNYWVRSPAATFEIEAPGR